MTTFTPRSKNSTTYTTRSRSDVTTSDPAGTSMGLLLALTYAVDTLTVNTTYTARSKNATTYTPRTRN